MGDRKHGRVRVHEPVAIVKAYDPHEEAPADDDWPDGQAAQNDEETPEYEPEAQLEQLDDPVVAEYRPAEHAAHAPPTLYWPAGHAIAGAQALAPATEDRPEAQPVHAEDPAPE